MQCGRKPAPCHALVGLVVLGEVLGAVQWMAVLLVVAASVGATRTGRIA
jgi:inner membrane transporter RhtA